ncbi:MAG TPA: hypothetical protein VD884_06615 [Ohtaekwangia sp.]|nr:hypothetical protein [Ohtaekwangia sp.]
MSKMNLFVFCVLLVNCSSKQIPQITPEESLWVYHIQPDAALDDPTFKLCDPKTAYPYYSVGAGYAGDKRELMNYFLSQFKNLDSDSSQTGFITIRFMINCQGLTGRFRLIEFDEAYKPFSFDPSISKQLLDLTKELKEWIPGKHGVQNYDSYYYLCFKIRNGTLIDITP